MWGKGVSDGIAIGIIKLYSKDFKSYDTNRATDSKAEIARFNVARKKVREDLEMDYKLALDEENETNADLMYSFLALIDDSEYLDAIKTEIRQKSVSAMLAVSRVRDYFCELFLEIEDQYIQARAEDIKDISDRILASLSGKKEAGPILTEKCILLADDLSPSETMKLDSEKLLAIVTRRGSKLSHTAILAKSMGIPAMVGVNFTSDLDGKLAIVDAFLGQLIIEPDEATLTKYKNRQLEMIHKAKELNELISLPSITRDGKSICLGANVGSLSDVKLAISYGCEEIGLFRTEFVFIDDIDYPSEEKQYELYSSAVKMLDGKNITIRTIDLGGDKMVPYMNLRPEDNPALGMRAIRFCLGHKDIFKTQIRAILRASLHGPVSILLPLVISIEEIWQIKSIINEVKQDLDRNGIAYGSYRLGAMIETPAAAIISDLIAREVDFISIGTNDLTQYTLAVDRQNAELEFICDYHHEAVLRLLRLIISNSHENGCKVCVCGELAADISFTQELINMGVDELSVVPNLMPKVKKTIRESLFASRTKATSVNSI